jgi:DNA-binding GntR family transcriptional regulator
MTTPSTVRGDLQKRPSAERFLALGRVPLRAAVVPSGLFEVLSIEREDHGHVMTRIREEVSARMPRPEERRDLRLPPGGPVLDMLHTSLDQQGHPYEPTRFVMRADLTGLLYDVPVE